MNIPVKYIDTTKYKVKIHQELDGDSPRDWVNFGHMICSHRNYVLGDEQFDDNDYDGWADLKQYLIKERGAKVILPLMLYDHSGITMYIGDEGIYHQHEAWDSGQVGFIYATAKDIKDNFMVNKVTKDLLKKTEQTLRSEVKTYDQYLTGDVYWVEIETDTGLEVDSLSGIYGNEGIKDYINEVIGDAEYDAIGIDDGYSTGSSTYEVAL